MTAPSRDLDCIVVGTADPERVAAGVIRMAMQWQASHPNWVAAEAHMRSCEVCSAASPGLGHRSPSDRPRKTVRGICKNCGQAFERDVVNPTQPPVRCADCCYVRDSATLESRFWSRVNKDGPVPDYRPELGPCWLWTGGLNQGYGRLVISHRPYRVVPAHQFAYEMIVGPVSEGLELDHLCRVRACVRPEHLEAVTHRVNVLRGESPMAEHATKTHCPRGHAYTPDNTWLQERQGGVSRKCKQCDRDRRQGQCSAGDRCPDGVRLNALAEPERVAFEQLTGQVVVR